MDSFDSVKSSLFLATAAPGLEPVVQEEIEARIPGAWIYATFRGRILFGASAPLDELLKLRCVDNLYAHIAWLPAGPHKQDLLQLAKTIAGLDLAPALAHLDRPVGGLNAKDLSARALRVTVSASRSGKHAFSRFDAAAAVLDELVERKGFRPGRPDASDAAFRLDLIDDQALFSLKLSPPELRFRGEARQFSPAALRPTVAAALVWLSRPAESDVFLDPCCGSGTIAIERGAYPARRIIAGDISEEALAAARQNAALQGVAGLETHQWDARRLPLDAGSVSAVVTNPPWGGQIDAGADLAGFYTEFLAEAKRVLVPGGRMIVLTDRRREVEEACAALGLGCRVLCAVSLHGQLPAVYRIG